MKMNERSALKNGRTKEWIFFWLPIVDEKKKGRRM
jgi:hypothetical protein